MLRLMQGGPMVRIRLPPALQRRVSCEPDFLGSDFRKGQVAMARLVTSSCTGTSRKLCGRSVVNWRASVHSAEAVIGATGYAIHRQMRVASGLNLDAQGSRGDVTGLVGLTQERYIPHLRGESPPVCPG